MLHTLIPGQLQELEFEQHVCVKKKPSTVYIYSKVHADPSSCGMTLHNPSNYFIQWTSAALNQPDVYTHFGHVQAGAGLFVSPRTGKELKFAIVKVSNPAVPALCQIAQVALALIDMGSGQNLLGLVVQRIAAPVFVSS